MEKTVEKKPHSITLDNRSRAHLTGITKVVASSERALTLETGAGGLTFYGSGLKINKFDADSGAMTFEGAVDKLEYSGVKIPLLKKLFK
ncbi:MAG: YabP/YqfC family sporulation protein [Clostridiales bacterium]|jgi:sporulation protein YabP|nr:YabP/YqfC family sporulation protein [Clostridiales bacterium]